MSKLEIETYPTLPVRVSNLRIGAIFGEGDDLYIKISGNNRGVNLSTGAISSFSSDDEVDDCIEGMIRIVRDWPQG